MPQPTLQAVHINRPLTNISQAYMQDSDSYIAPKIFPIVPVQKKSDLYFKYTKAFWFRDLATERAPGTESSGGGYEVTTDSYLAKRFAHHKMVDPEIRANTDDPLNADRDATLWVTHLIALRREIEVLSTVLKTGVWTGSTSGTDVTPGTIATTGMGPAWDTANSTPLEDFQAQITAIRQQTGRYPNRLVLGAHAWSALRNHDELVQRIKYTQRGVVTTDLLASLIAPPGVTDFQVLVGDTILNKGVEGGADDFEFIAPTKDALLLYAEPQPGIMVPSAGYIFSWVGFLGVGAFTMAVYSIPMNWFGMGTVRVEAEMAFAVKVVSGDLGCYFSGAVAA